MFTPVTHSKTPSPELEAALAAVEMRLAALGTALYARDAAGKIGRAHV